jgi:site-specific DNA recombinase
MVGAYTRVSTKDQIIDEGSLVNQEAKIRRYCDYKFPNEKVKVYEERGISGRTVEHREVFQQLKADIAKGKLSHVVFTNMSRAFRNTKDAVLFCDFVKQYKVNLSFTDLDINTASAHGKIFFTLMAALAEFESDQLSERGISAYTERTERGLRLGGQNPLGYIAESGKLKKYAPEVKIVKTIFREYMCTGSLFAVAVLMNQIYPNTKRYNVDPKTEEKTIILEKRTWHASSIKYVLTNPIYIGQLSFRRSGKDVKAAQWEPIVSIKEFAAVQKLIEKQGKTHHNTIFKATHDYKLTGGVTCECGRSMVGTKLSNRNKSYYYYRCSRISSVKGIKNCNNMVRQDMLEAQVFGIVDHIIRNSKNEIITKAFNDAIRNEEKLAQKYRETLAHIEDILAHLYKAKDKLIDTMHKLTDKSLIAEQNAKLKEVTDELTTLTDARDETAQFIQDAESYLADGVIAQIWQSMQNKKQRFADLPADRQVELTKSIITSIKVTKAKTVKYTFSLPEFARMYGEQKSWQCCIPYILQITVDGPDIVDAQVLAA